MAANDSASMRSVPAVDRAARALYEKWAFTEEGRRKSYYKDPEEDALVFKFSFPE